MDFILEIETLLTSNSFPKNEVLFELQRIIFERQEQISSEVMRQRESDMNFFELFKTLSQKVQGKALYYSLYSLSNLIVQGLLLHSWRDILSQI